MRLKYIGQAASYTIDRHTWLRGETKSTEGIDEAHVAHAVRSGLFREVTPVQTVQPTKGALKLKGKQVDAPTPDEPADLADTPPEWPANGFQDKNAAIAFASEHLGLALESKKALATLNEIAWETYERKYGSPGDDEQSMGVDEAEIDTGVTV